MWESEGAEERGKRIFWRIEGCGAQPLPPAGGVIVAPGRIARGWVLGVRGPTAEAAFGSLGIAPKIRARKLEPPF